MIKSNKILAYLSVKYEGDWLKIYDAILKKETVKAAEVEKTLSSLKCKYVTLFDEEYPPSLKNVFRPPFTLFYYGDISLIQNHEKCLSVVGSRESTFYGENCTREIVKEVAKDFNIVSGMAKGIDTIAHTSSLDVGGKTIAVLGCGIDYVYPKENFELYEKIKKDHLIISEYPNDTPPKPYYFPIRNRIIALLSKALLVTEAASQSGTLTTVAVAISSGKDVMCIPYPFNQGSECNRIIKDGGFLVDSPKDVYEVLGVFNE